MTEHRPNRTRNWLVACGVGIVAVTALPMLPTWRHAPERNAPNVAAREILVDLRDNATDADVQDLDARFGLNLAPNSIEWAQDKLMRATLPPNVDEAQLLTQLRSDARVEAAEPDFVVSMPEVPARDERAAPSSTIKVRSHRSDWAPNDPRYGEQWNFKMVGAEKAWKRARGKGIVVAVLDTGVAAKDSKRGKRARDFDKTKFVAGYDFVHHDDDPYDDNGHGTHVAGTIAEATNNGEGVAGLAFEAKIMPVKVLSGGGSGTLGDIADAIRWAADHGANVINMSLGSRMPSRILHNAVKYASKKGVLVVCSAGNGFGLGVSYPGAFPECLAVASVGPSGERAPYSSYGPEVGLAAPGGDMMTSGNENDGVLQNTIYPEEQGGRGDDYYHFQGTSMASPHIAAMAALVMSQGVSDPARVRDILLRSAHPKEPKLEYGAGLADAGAATKLASGERRNALCKAILCALFGLPLLAQSKRRVWRPWNLRWLLVGAFWLGAFGPDFAAAHFGADSALNLLSFSALLPFVLFWEWENGFKSKVVAALSSGVAFCLGASLLARVSADGLSPFTDTTFGSRALLWTGANCLAALILAGVAKQRGEN